MTEGHGLAANSGQTYPERWSGAGPLPVLLRTQYTGLLREKWHGPIIKQCWGLAFFPYISKQI